jgi:hypothetical protein
LKSFLKTATYLLEQSDRRSAEMRDQISERVDRARNRVSDLRDRAQELYGHDDHTIRNVVCFAAGVGVGVGAAILFAPASGEQVRSSIEETVQTGADRVRDHFSSKKVARAPRPEQKRSDGI